MTAMIAQPNSILLHSSPSGGTAELGGCCAGSSSSTNRLVDSPVVFLNDWDDEQHHDRSWSGSSCATATTTMPKYQIVRPIGQGASGRAFLVRRTEKTPPATSISHINGDGTPNVHNLFVAKVVEFSGMDDKKRRYAMNEHHCQMALKHFALATQVDYHETEDGRKAITIVELGDAGDLAAIIKGRGQLGRYFAEHEAAFLILQLVLAVDAMHRQRMLHRDIKAANVFVQSCGLVKLGDFGFAKQYEETVSDDVAHSFCGSPAYVAPELWRRERYSKKADVFSLGVLAYELVCLKRPFAAQTVVGLADAICRGRVDPLPSDRYTREFQDVILSMLLTRPEERCSTAQVLCMPYMKRVMHEFAVAIQAQSRVHPLLKQDIFRTLAETRDRLDRPMELLSDSLLVEGESPSQGGMTPSSTPKAANSATRLRSPSTGRLQHVPHAPTAHRSSVVSNDDPGSLPPASGSRQRLGPAAVLTSPVPRSDAMMLPPGAVPMLRSPGSGVTQGIALPPLQSTAATQSTPPILDTVLYKLCTDGWKRRQVVLTHREICVQVVNVPEQRKSLKVRHIVECRPIVVTEDLAPFGEQHDVLTSLKDFGFELEVQQGKRVVFVATNRDLQQEWLRALGDVIAQNMNKVF